ncbi:MAG: aldehyde ferredoxin oxidoreductase family protein [Proteobacteria bacterium]|nr:aldehyde ferredoxin oxidoreductase family protein [Pseudomonadota bacterium]
MNGYFGKALQVDLETGATSVLTVPEEWYQDYIGGEGVGVRLFFEHFNWNSAPRDEDSPIILASGPLTGTNAPCSGRTCVVYRSPSTGTLGLSNVGGRLGKEIRKAGWDFLVILGRSKHPVVLNIDNDQAELLDGSDLWGKNVPETDQAVKDRIGKEGVQVACIGPAGENQVLYASLMTDKERAAGRGGIGALMGMKKIKAIAVRGDNKMPVSSPEKLKEVAAATRNEMLSEHFIKEALKPFGTPSFYDSMSSLGLLPTKNWQRTSYPESIETMGMEAYHKTLEVKPYACSNCPIGCGRHTTIKEGPYAGDKGGGPEFETMGAFGSKCLIKDISVVAKASHLCNNLGLDTISTGQTIATAMEWYENGILTSEQTDGIDLSWGNGEAVLETVRKIATRDGLGNLLADGVKRAAKKLGNGADHAAMHVKGLEMSSCGVRASKGEAISFAVSPRGGDHLRPYASTIDAFGYRDVELGITEEVDYLEDGNKSWVKPLQELSMATNMLGVCLFGSITLGVKPESWARLLSTVTGKPISGPELLKAAERVLNMERMINAKLGFNRKNDTLPKRLLTEPAPDSRGKGQVVDLDKVLDSYYHSMGWEITTGLPKSETLEKLNLSWLS